MLTVLFAAALLAASPVSTQTAPSATPDAAPPPEFMTAAQGFGQCIGKSIKGQPVTATPEAAAKQALAGCSAERTALDARFEGWVGGPNFPEAGRSMAREQFQAQMTGMEAQLAESIRASRAKPAASPSPAPTPQR